MASVICIESLTPADPLEIELPGIGLLQFVKQKIDDVPRVSDYVLQMMNATSPAFAPIRNILRVLDVILATQKCIQAIPDALIPPNPRPILDCISGLTEAVAALLEFIPPFSYARMIFQILRALRQLLDDMIITVNQIDAQISVIKAAISKGTQTGNTRLIEIGECAKKEIEDQTESFLIIFEALGKLLAVLGGVLSILASLLPPLKNSVGGVGKALQNIDQLIANGIPPVEDFPGLSILVDSITILRNAIHAVELAVGAAIGQAQGFVPPPTVVLENP